MTHNLESYPNVTQMGLMFIKMILQNMSAYPYKTQLKIVVESMALHNYIRRRSQDDIIFAEYDRNPNFVPEDILPDVVP